jgi:ATP-binding protein involved in chromosome partitioning
MSPVPGVVENMSFQVCEECGHHSTPFPASDQPLDDEDGTPIEVLARIPLASELCAAADLGRSLVLEPGEGEVKRAFLELAKKLAIEVGALVRGTAAAVRGMEQAEAARSAPMGA